MKTLLVVLAASLALGAYGCDDGGGEDGGCDMMCVANVCDVEWEECAAGCESYQTDEEWQECMDACDYFGALCDEGRCGCPPA